MQRSPAFTAPDARAVLEDLAASGPATLVTVGPDGLSSTIVPLLVDGDRLVGHVARQNHDVLHADGTEAIAVWVGPQGYISPSWYPSKADHGRVVPTWDYVTVQVAGPLRCTDDRRTLLDLVTRLTDRHEAGRAEPWQVADAPADHIDRLLGAIVGIELAIERLDAKAKLSQNRPSADIDGVIEALGATDPALAAAVRAARP